MITNKKLSYIIFFTLFVFFTERLVNISAYNAIRDIQSNSFIYFAWILNATLLIRIFWENRLISILSLISLCYFDAPVMYGADTFAFNLCVLMCLIKLKEEKRDFFTKLGYFILFSTLTVIYLYNGFAKVNDALWQEGKVLIYLLKIDLAKAGDLQGLLIMADKFLSYFVVLLQFLIPLIFVKKLRKIISALFICKHLFISLVLHPFFGMLCVVTHLLVFLYDGNPLRELKDEIRA